MEIESESENSYKLFLKKIKEKVKKVIKKVIDIGKDLIKRGIIFLHIKLSLLEDYLLLKLTELGAYAERKIDERM